MVSGTTGTPTDTIFCVIQGHKDVKSTTKRSI